MQDVNWAYIKGSDDIQDVFWLPYVRSIYAQCPRESLISKLILSGVVALVNYGKSKILVDVNISWFVNFFDQWNYKIPKAKYYW